MMSNARNLLALFGLIMLAPLLLSLAIHAAGLIGFLLGAVA